jgi:hypothetical protein
MAKRRQQKRRQQRRRRRSGGRPSLLLYHTTSTELAQRIYEEGFEDRSFIDGRTLSGEQRRGSWFSDKPLVFTGDVLRGGRYTVLVIRFRSRSLTSTSFATFGRVMKYF